MSAVKGPDDPSGPVDLCWVRGRAGGTDGAYVNVGDALSPVVTALVSGRTPRFARAAGDARSRRMTAIGTIMQKISGGHIDVWGTGSSPFQKPNRKDLPWRIPPDTAYTVHATRGPFTAARLGVAEGMEIPFGDPAWLLPRFYSSPVEKRWDLGLVIHISGVADTGYEARPLPGHRRHRVPESLQGRIRLITMYAPATLEGIRAKIDEIRACRHIVSSSLHGLVIADAYGIPSLYLSAFAPRETGLAHARLDTDVQKGVNPRFIDLFAGMGREEMAFWSQPLREPTDWDALIAAIGAAWEPGTCDVDRLIRACPAGYAPLSAPQGGTIWDHPVLRAIELVSPETSLRRLGRVLRLSVRR